MLLRATRVYAVAALIAVLVVLLLTWARGGRGAPSGAYCASVCPVGALISPGVHAFPWNQLTEAYPQKCRVLPGGAICTQVFLDGQAQDASTFLEALPEGGLWSFNGHPVEALDRETGLAGT